MKNFFKHSLLFLCVMSFIPMASIGQTYAKEKKKENKTTLKSRSSREKKRIVTPKVVVTFSSTSPVYRSRPFNFIQKRCYSVNQKMVNLSCTFAKFSYSQTQKYTSYKKGTAQISKIHVKFFYKPENLYVYIDEKYPVNSCEYNAIKMHEDFHVKVAQSFGTKQAKKSLTTCIHNANKKLLPRSKLDMAVRSCISQAIRNEEQRRRKQNASIDSSHSTNLRINCPTKYGNDTSYSYEIYNVK